MHELIGGDGDGPTIGISAAMHGDENTGSQAMLELYRRLASIPFSGRLLLLPVANSYAMIGNRRFAPFDNLNLNREFPGNAQGSFTQQLAATITEEFLEKIDVHIDLHTGTDRPTVDYTYLWNDEGLTRSFGSKILYRPDMGSMESAFRGTSADVTYRLRKIPAAVIELGGGIVDQTPYVRRTVDGVLNMLRYLGVIEGEVARRDDQIIITRLSGIRPTSGGWVEPLAPPLGEPVRGADPLARIVCPYTFETIDEIRSPYANGIMVMGHLTRNLVEAGDFGFMVGDLDSAEPTVA
ncbi:succinylglutamate desuccinylase/aspartoacylase family protein [Sphingomonas nostoxanthinifaciens]|uniref:succinylglutamate desuccinylase/aspartoacylase family protein n=1 Tax=Sphingomonas nostoxanthinifaciens TaxID=2872652 RepID=UPI001CC1EB0D|nr:succinylglutamate desuccinylase/aspartoacylase family protein [Sphingomonas nostoxanthinifaciens]UAK25808.1 succinylglutamate desuccinylase/aspartoacylase family protein [Sphingomonas nostoxanthinifaciens]